ncbi:MAG TPA: hypothetical protein VLS90_08030, partial [Thermodesulfobacteriota bacterium]|nr:hypothetical protein [Thermodesulfobacteriota bacterium]
PCPGNVITPFPGTNDAFTVRGLQDKRIIRIPPFPVKLAFRTIVSHSAPASRKFPSIDTTFFFLIEAKREAIIAP